MPARAKNPGKGAFGRCVAKVSASGARSPRGVCAAAGRKKYGAQKFARMAAAGRKKAAKAKSNARKKTKRKNIGVGMVSPELFTGYAVPFLKKTAGKISKQANLRHQKVKVKKARRKNPAKNPAAAAAEVYEQFHGRPSTEVVEIVTPIHEHKHLSGIGELVLLRIQPEHRAGTIDLTEFKGALLAQNEKRNQLFIEGGDQSVDLRMFGVRKPVHESEVLGKLTHVEYYTIKDHLGDEGGEAVYRHRLRKVGMRSKPTVIYDTVNKLLTISGGAYTIPDEGIKD